jgi:light-regulated signal transduction histidine kinase (bacteriophytochrome)
MGVPKSGKGEHGAAAVTSSGNMNNRAAKPPEPKKADRQGRSEELERLLADCNSRLTEARDGLQAERIARSDAEKEKRRLNEELDRQKTALRNVSQELESFSYSISHDLRAPLRHLIGFSGALVEDYAEGLEPTAKSYLDCIMRAGRKMENLVDALLGLSRIGRQDMTLLNLDLSQMARSFAACLREREPAREVAFNIQEQLPAHGDAVLLRAAVEQLMENAWKFTGKTAAAAIEVGSREEEGERVYYVRDNGAGFDLRFAERLFSPFQRMHREEEFPGIGIGLATVQRIISRHGGRIWVEAEPDHGATFYFTVGT